VRSDVCPLFFALGSANRLASVFEDAGLTDIHTQRLTTRLEWTSPDQACDAAFAGGPVAHRDRRLRGPRRIRRCDRPPARHGQLKKRARSNITLRMKGQSVRGRNSGGASTKSALENEPTKSHPNRKEMARAIL